MDYFELFIKMNYINPSEMALSLMGLDYGCKKESLTDTQFIVYEKIRKIISRNVEYYERSGIKQNVTKIHNAYNVLAASYPFIIDGITPKIIIDHIDKAIIRITQRSGWRDTLQDLGGDELLERGKILRTGGRGEYRKNDEEKGNYKMIAVLVKMLAESGKSNYGSFSKPAISEIYRDLVNLCENNGIDLKGLAESTFYKKVKEANHFLNE